MTDSRITLMINMMGVSEDEWDEMTEEQRKEVAQEFVRTVNEALKPVVETIKTEVIPKLNRIANDIAEPMIDAGDQLQEAKLQGDLNMNQLDQGERDEVNRFINKTRDLKRMRGQR